MAFLYHKIVQEISVLNDELEQKSMQLLNEGSFVELHKFLEEIEIVDKFKNLL